MAGSGGAFRGAIERISGDRRKTLGAGLVGVLIGGVAVALASQSGVGAADPDRARIEGIVRNPDIDRLLAEDDKLKVVWRELPVLGPDSQVAAEASLAAAREGDFRAFHETLFSLGRPTAANIAEAKETVGVTTIVPAAEARAEIDKNYELARAVNATGTPTFVVGDQVLQGAVGYDALKQAIAEARAAE